MLIVGGGASGVLLAAHLLQLGDHRVTVSIIEKGGMLGCGVAYATQQPAHLLNTRVANMSAYTQAPDHFLDWLRSCEPAAADPQGFVSRATYGRYMRSLLGDSAAGLELNCHQGECVALDATTQGIMTRLASGTTIKADLVVLATGHSPPPVDPLLTQPWSGLPVAPDEDVLIVGSGLTMVDQLLSLLAAGHRGNIVALLRKSA